MTEHNDDAAEDAHDEAVNEGGAAAPEGVVNADDELQAAKDEAEENLNKYMRLAADMENLRKRTVREVESARRFGVERFAGELLVVCDSLEMGLETGQNASVESLLEGKSATLKLLQGAMTKSGIEQINPEGELFDPQFHEALTMQPSATAEPGSVLTVVQVGYQLNGRLLRPARVIVAADPVDEEPEAGSA